MTAEHTALFRETIQHHSKSFAFASALIPAASRYPVEVLYTWCRCEDDAIDLAPPEARDQALADLERDLDQIYSGVELDGTLQRAMQRVVTEFAIPREYPGELLQGMAMDAGGTVYEDLDDLLLYCYRVAGTVGLMMSHVLGVRETQALQHAVHLGIAMQLTNICRDVSEDWENRRCYIPRALLIQHGAGHLDRDFGQPLDPQFRPALARCVEQLLDLADLYYASADAGMRCLSWRAAFSVRAARHIYADIGVAIHRQDCNVFAARARVSRSRKITLALKALVQCLVELPWRASHRFARAPLSTPLRFPDDVLILDGGG